MKHPYGNRKAAAVLLAAGILVSGAGMAANNENGRGRDDDRGQRNERADDQHKGRFDDQQRAAARDYFASQSRAGKCPPGLAKKNNGCNPPGQVKQWQIGQQLPQQVTWYEVTRELETQLGQAPVGYRYASVENDILLLELGTQLVVDVIQSLGE